MKTIKQQAEVTYSAITIKEAILMAPLMDELIRQVNYVRALQKFTSLPKEEKEKYYLPHGYSNIKNVEKIFDMLTQLGFCGTDNEELLP